MYAIKYTYKNELIIWARLGTFNYVHEAIQNAIDSLQTSRAETIKVKFISLHSFTVTLYEAYKFTVFETDEIFQKGYHFQCLLSTKKQHPEIYHWDLVKLNDLN